MVNDLNINKIIKRGWFLIKSRFDIGIKRFYEDYKGKGGQQFYACYTHFLGPISRFRIHLFGRVWVGEMRLSGWSGPISLYAFHCEKHGYQLDYPHGFNDRLDCPDCQLGKEMKGL